jgi:hypothetical protein
MNMTRITLPVVVVLALTGCASMRNTPQQDATYALFAQCKAETNSSALLKHVYPNGSFTWLAGSGPRSYIGDESMVACLQKAGRRFEWTNVPRTGTSRGSPEKTMEHFEACKQESGYYAATISELNPDGSFRYGGGDPVANKAFKVCMTGKGHPMD